MTDGLRMSTISNTERRNDLHLTTTGVGHAYRPPVKLKKIKPKIFQPLPRKWTAPCQLTVSDVYTTSTEEEFCPKNGDNQSAQHTKAPSLLKMNYTLDTSNKLNQKPWRPPLTMGNQCSEMHDKFTGKCESKDCQPEYSIAHQTIQDHFKEGSTKSLMPSNTIPELQGKQINPSNQAILERLQPYMTNNHWYHRHFTSGELQRYPKKNVATFWQCEDYPKAWGFGTATNPLPKRENKTDPGPMRDRMVFKQSTNSLLSRPTKQHTPLSSWLKSTYSTTHTHLQQKPFMCPPFPKMTKDESLLHSVPNMYNTSNMSYGDTND